jgi:hypothetical protein
VRRGGIAVILAALVGLMIVTPLPHAPAATPTATDHLAAIVQRSPPPEYRRFGSAGIAQVAQYAAGQLQSADYLVRAQDVPSERYAIDYASGHEPLLERVSDHQTYKADSTFSSTAPTGVAGITCTLRLPADVTPGDCGFLTFSDASPAWNNVLAKAGTEIDQIIANGGIGAVIQGDLPRNLVFALRIKKPIPSVVAVVAEGDVVGQVVHIRAMGAIVPATLHNVVAVRRPPAGATQYVLLNAHIDGFYQAAADNGSGAAAVLAAAQDLSDENPNAGLIFALYDGEEFGLLGSKAFADTLLSPAGFDVGDCGVPLSMANIKAVVNLDASSARASDAQDVGLTILESDVPLFSWRAIVFSEEPVLSATAIAAFAQHGVLGAPVSVSIANPANGGISRTDGRWFHEAGVPVVWPVAGYPEYHTDGDGLATVDQTDLEAVAAGAAEVVRAIAPLPVGRVVGAPALPPAATTRPAACSAAAGEGSGAGSGDRLANTP